MLVVVSTKVVVNINKYNPSGLKMTSYKRRGRDDIILTSIRRHFSTICALGYVFNYFIIRGFLAWSWNDIHKMII